MPLLREAGRATWEGASTLSGLLALKAASCALASALVSLWNLNSAGTLFGFGRNPRDLSLPSDFLCDLGQECRPPPGPYIVEQDTGAQVQAREDRSEGRGTKRTVFSCPGICPGSASFPGQLLYPHLLHPHPMTLEPPHSRPLGEDDCAKAQFIPSNAMHTLEGVVVGGGGFIQNTWYCHYSSYLGYFLHVCHHGN